MLHFFFLFPGCTSDNLESIRDARLEKMERRLGEKKAIKHPATEEGVLREGSSSEPTDKAKGTMEGCERLDRALQVNVRNCKQIYGCPHGVRLPIRETSTFQEMVLITALVSSTKDGESCSDGI